MKKFITTGVILLSPLSAFALLQNTTTLATDASNIITRWLIPMAFSLALLFFFWGVAKYILSAGGAKEEGRQIMVWGIVALFVMSSVWGLVRFFRGEFGVQEDAFMQVPRIQQ